MIESTDLHVRARFAVPLAAWLVLACSSDDGGVDEASESGDSSSSTGTDSTGTDSTGAADSTDTNSTDTDSSTESTGDSTDETGDPPACGPAEPLGDWLLALGGDLVFPNDVPSDVDESCLVLAGSGPDTLALDCPFAPFEIQLYGITTSLPAPGEGAQVRIHHEPGWLEWPDLWISVEIEDGDHFAFQASSVLHPSEGPYLVPWSPDSSGLTCGPYEDICGPQQIEALEFEIEGELVSAWHGTHETSEVAGLPFEVWLLSARENLAPPETCDFSPRWYSIVTRRGS
jgi:hypothetical protein